MGVPLGQSLKPFCKLRDPSSYVGCTWDLTLDAAGRSHWTGFHRRHIRTLLGLAIEAAAARGESPEAVNARAQKPFEMPGCAREVKGLIGVELRRRRGENAPPVARLHASVPGRPRSSSTGRPL